MAKKQTESAKKKAESAKTPPVETSGTGSDNLGNVEVTVTDKRSKKPRRPRGQKRGPPIRNRLRYMMYRHREITKYSRYKYPDVFETTSDVAEAVLAGLTCPKGPGELRCTVIYFENGVDQKKEFGRTLFTPSQWDDIDDCREDMGKPEIPTHLRPWYGIIEFAEECGECDFDDLPTEDQVNADRSPDVTYDETPSDFRDTAPNAGGPMIEA